MVLIHGCLHKLQQYQFFQECSQILDSPITYSDIALGYKKISHPQQVLIILVVLNPQQPQRRCSSPLAYDLQ